MSVFVLGTDKRPLMPCSEKRARLLLERKRAAVFRRYPFTIILKDRTQDDCDLQEVRIKLDPGSKVTGIAITRESKEETSVLFLAELTHRGNVISEKLTARSSMRRRRRGNLRYRPARFNNRTKHKGWLAPSLRHRVETTMSWVNRFIRFTPITGISMELVRFDMQTMQNPDINGVEYQQGELTGYEVREYLLEKWGRKCAYCGATDIPLQIEHIVPKARGGSNRISNLTLACEKCNQTKGAKSVEEFLSKRPDILRRIKLQMKRPLKDASAVNATRWSLFNALASTGLKVKCGSGGRTKYNRMKLGLPKTHALDAVAVGEVNNVTSWNVPTLGIKAAGRGTYKRTHMDKYGFPRSYLMRKKRIHGFQTGDMVHVVVPKGKNKGIYVGRVAVRTTGMFNIKCNTKLAIDTSYKNCRVVHCADGYNYSQCKEMQLNWLELAAHNRQVVGSSPTISTNHYSGR